MNQHIAIVAATQKEISPFLDYLKKEATEHSFQTYGLHGFQIDILYSGIGIFQTTYALMDYLSHRHPNGWIQAGIGGAFDLALTIGTTYLINQETLAGFGAQKADGRILDPFELGWNDPDAFPYNDGLLRCPYTSALPLFNVTGMTVFHASGNAGQIERLRESHNGQIENMEGFPFFFISLVKKIPFLSLRSVSNKVEPRDTSKWKIEPAIENLNNTLIEMLTTSKFSLDKLFLPIEVRSHE